MSPSTLNRLSSRNLAVQSLDQLPPFSPVLNHLMASLANEDVSFAELASMIERDTVLSGNVLRLVNSALYGRQGSVSSVRAAVSMLGLGRLRNALLGLSVSRMWGKVRTPESWDMARFNRHSAAVAVLADLLVQKLNVEYAEGAFAAGLLHDLGRLMIAISLPEEHERIRQAYEAGGQPIEHHESELLEVNHSELSAMALARWNLPVPIQKAVLYHHKPEFDPSGSAGAITLSVVVSGANGIASAVGYALTDVDAERAGDAGAILKSLDLEGQQSALMSQFDAEFSAMRATFD